MPSSPSFSFFLLLSLVVFVAAVERGMEVEVFYHQVGCQDSNTPPDYDYIHSGDCFTNYRSNLVLTLDGNSAFVCNYTTSNCTARTPDPCETYPLNKCEPFLSGNTTIGWIIISSLAPSLSPLSFLLYSSIAATVTATLLLF